MMFNVKSAVMEIEINELVFLKVSEEFVLHNFWVMFEQIHKNDMLISFLREKKIDYYQIGNSNYFEIIVNLDMTLSHMLSHFFISCDAEIVTLLFPKDNFNIDNFINYYSISHQIKSYCASNCFVTCTWIMSENQLRFMYDTDFYSLKNLDNIKQQLGKRI